MKYYLEFYLIIFQHLVSDNYGPSVGLNDSFSAIGKKAEPKNSRKSVGEKKQKNSDKSTQIDSSEFFNKCFKCLKTLYIKSDFRFQVRLFSWNQLFSNFNF